MAKRRESTNTANYDEMYARLRYPDKQRLEKKLKDAEVAAITKGRVKGPTRKTRISAFIELFILDHPNTPAKKLVREIQYLFGKKLKPAYIHTLRWRTKKAIQARKLSTFK